MLSSSSFFTLVHEVNRSKRLEICNISISFIALSIKHNAGLTSNILIKSFIVGNQAKLEMFTTIDVLDWLDWQKNYISPPRMVVEIINHTSVSTKFMCQILFREGVYWVL